MGGYQNPLPGMVTVNPIADIISGMVQGAQLHARLQAAEDEHMAMQRQAVQQERNNRIQDIQQQMLLGDTSRPVSPAGTVQGDPVSIVQGMTGENGPPNPMGDIPITLPGAIRKADASRTVKYKTQDGQTIMRELYTPEEQNAIAARRKQQQVDAGMIDVPIPPALQGEYGGAKTIKSTPSGVAGILRDMNQLARQNETFDISPEDQKTYGVPAQMKGDLYDNFLAMKSRHMADQDAADKAAKTQDRIDARADKREASTAAATNAREDAVDKRAADREQRQKNGQIVGVTLKKQAALSSAEAAYRTEVNRLKLSAKLTPEEKQAQIAVAQKRLRDAKQAAQNAYEEAAGALGKPIEHFEYPSVEEAQQQATPPQAGGRGAQPKAAKVLDLQTATSYLKKAGGDKDKARKLALADGYTIPAAPGE